MQKNEGEPKKVVRVEPETRELVAKIIRESKAAGVPPDMNNIKSIIRADKYITTSRDEGTLDPFDIITPYDGKRGEG